MQYKTGNRVKEIFCYAMVLFSTYERTVFDHPLTQNMENLEKF